MNMLVTYYYGYHDLCLGGYVVKLYRANLD